MSGDLSIRRGVTAMLSLIIVIQSVTLLAVAASAVGTPPIKKFVTPVLAD